MRKIMFLCHGNICRSTAAEVIAFNYVREHNLEHIFQIASRALSNEETGNNIYPPMRNVLLVHEREVPNHFAKKITRDEFLEYDEVYYMDEENLDLIEYYFPTFKDKCKKIRYLIDDRDIEDPWYTRNFEKVYYSIKEAVIKILENN